MLTPLQSPSLKDVFIERFEDLILSGKLRIGQKLPSERELALQLAGAGNDVIATGRDPERLAETERALAGDGHRTVVADLTVAIDCLRASWASFCLACACACASRASPRRRMPGLAST